MNRRQALAAITAIIAAPSRLSAQTPERYSAGATPVEGDAVIFLAQSDGSFTKAGLTIDIQKLASGEAIAAGVTSGDIAIGSMNTLSLAIAHQNGIDLKIIAPGVLYDNAHTGSQIFIPKTLPYSSGRDLNGKTFAVNVLHGAAQLFAESWIDKRGGDSKTIRWIEMSFSIMEPALIAGRIDGALIVPPFATSALTTCRSLGPPGDGIAARFLTSCYVVTQPWLAAHRDAAARFNTVISSTARRYNNDPASSVQAVAELTRQDPAVIVKAVRAIFGEKVDPALIQPVIDSGAKYGLLKRSFPVSEIIG